MSTRDFSWGKGSRCVWLTTYHPCSAETSRKSGALTYLEEPLGPPRPVVWDLYLRYSLMKLLILSIYFSQIKFSYVALVHSVWCNRNQNLPAYFHRRHLFSLQSDELLQQENIILKIKLYLNHEMLRFEKRHHGRFHYNEIQGKVFTLQITALSHYL